MAFPTAISCGVRISSVSDCLRLALQRQPDSGSVARGRALSPDVVLVRRAYGGRLTPARGAGAGEEQAAKTHACAESRALIAGIQFGSMRPVTSAVAPLLRRLPAAIAKPAPGQERSERWKQSDGLQSTVLRPRTQASNSWSSKRYAPWSTRAMVCILGPVRRRSDVLGTLAVTSLTSRSSRNCFSAAAP